MPSYVGNVYTIDPLVQLADESASLLVPPEPQHSVELLVELRVEHLVLLEEQVVLEVEPLGLRVPGISEQVAHVIVQSPAAALATVVVNLVLLLLNPALED